MCFKSVVKKSVCSACFLFFCPTVLKDLRTAECRQSVKMAGIGGLGHLRPSSQG